MWFSDKQVGKILLDKLFEGTGLAQNSPIEKIYRSRKFHANLEQIVTYLNLQETIILHALDHFTQRDNELKKKFEMLANHINEFLILLEEEIYSDETEGFVPEKFKEAITKISTIDADIKNAYTFVGTAITKLNSHVTQTNNRIAELTNQIEKERENARKFNDTAQGLIALEKKLGF